MINFRAKFEHYLHPLLKIGRTTQRFTYSGDLGWLWLFNVVSTNAVWWRTCDFLFT